LRLRSLRLRSLRLRIAAAFIIGSLAVTGSVGLATYGLVSNTLLNGREDSVKKQSFAGVKLARERLESSVADQLTAYDLVTALQRRGDVIVLHRNLWASSSATLDNNIIPANLRRPVKDGGVAYTTLGQPRRILFGSQIPPTESEVYFVFSLAAVDRTLGLLSRILLVLIGIAAVFAGIVGWRLAGTTIRPLRLASEAAHSVAEGNLDTRLEVSGEDELARLSRSFNQMTEALERRIGRERQFVADVSHELRTPLTALKTSIDFLAQRTDDLPSKFRGPLGLAAEEVRSLQRLVDDLLELSRMEAGDVAVEGDDVDLVAFAEQLARRRAPESDVRIHGPEHLVIRTDKMRLERVVGNLLENAVFHGGTEGVDIVLEQLNGRARIVVQDQGPGIDPEKLPWIFERFYRGDASRRRDGRVGSGLGLAIARENATLIGADIDVDSEPGRGTRFEVRVPNRGEK
jgi:two-component system, OmpR family, sensor histidine kinase MtrB